MKRRELRLPTASLSLLPCSAAFYTVSIQFVTQLVLSRLGSSFPGHRPSPSRAPAALHQITRIEQFLPLSRSNLRKIIRGHPDAEVHGERRAAARVVVWSENWGYGVSSELQLNTSEHYSTGMQRIQTAGERAVRVVRPPCSVADVGVAGKDVVRVVLRLEGPQSGQSRSAEDFTCPVLLTDPQEIAVGPASEAAHRVKDVF